MTDEQKKIPVSIITGFLGSGKTTLVNRILRDVRSSNTAVIINEFGATGIDGKFVEETKEEIIEINNGCICCNVRGDLIRILKDLLVRAHKEGTQLQRVVIETTGLANPAPVIQTFLMDDVMRYWFEIDCVSTVVDSLHIDGQLSEHEIAREQIAFADQIILNKQDLISQDKRNALIVRMQQMNPEAEIFNVQDSEVPLDKLLHVYSFSLDHTLRIRPDFLEQHHHHHHDDIQAIVLRDDRPLDAKRLDMWFSYLVQVKGESLFRYKGILHVAGEKRRVLFQGVHMLFASTIDREWKQGEMKQNELVFIGKDLNEEELRTGFAFCLGEVDKFQSKGA
ncbi:GTP-binding protein [Terribacillus sp. DMT04]|uniref:CobW family GTP-binding protein n=1 Tax=Terribacillus sp. DMT04 TaxID=2850441 RepID=UPI001C2CAA7A|nr:GTP-binding protein [Terribacillus sp. DMT04]QXE01041.1 GTP-binding protein [Terribacillus sp. DMT04]